MTQKRYVVRHGTTTSGSKVMAQIVVFVFSVTLTLTFDLCSILSHALRMMYWNIHAMFYKNPSNMNG